MTEKTSYRIKKVSIFGDKDIQRYRRVLRHRLSKKTEIIEKGGPVISTSSHLKGSLFNFAREPTAEAVRWPETEVEPSPIRKILTEGRQIKYLYLQLQEIMNVPKDNSKNYFLDLRHSMTNYTESKEINRNQKLSSFAIPIEQDDIDIANLFSDEPLVVSLTEILPPDKDNVERTKTIAEGHIDLIQFFTKKRSIIKTEIFLYPASTEYIMEVGTIKTVWHVYSLLPLIKSSYLNNMIFITLESIYNASSDIRDLSDDLGVRLSFRSKISKKNNQFERNEICTYTFFKRGTIFEQDPKFYWASAAKDGTHSLGKKTDCSLSIHKIFSDLLCTENVNFDFESISVHIEEALICNLMRRYIVNEELTNILQEIIAFDEQELIIEVYRCSEPDIVLLEGVIDLSIFLYPYVNSCRYAVELKQVDKVTTSKRPTGNPLNVYHKDGKVTFAIINICILQPITESQLSPNTFGEQTQAEAMKTCLPNKFLLKSVLKKAKEEICEDNFKDFDFQITSLIDYIIRKEIQCIEDAKGFLCCQKKNLTQKIMKLISCNFNVRVPTKNTIEFSNLMTFVYKDLERRCFEILLHCEKNKNCMRSEEHVQKVLLYMSTLKVLHEAGAEDMADIYRDKLKKLETVEFHVEGYTFLYNMEMQNFEEAKKRLRKPQQQKFLFGEYYDGLFEIYITYMETLQSETTFNQALEYLINVLERYSSRFQRQASIWILLYCIYNTCGYLPGMSFARLKFENINPEFVAKLPELPLSLWDIYCKCSLEFVTKKSIQFYEAMKEFLKLGLYKFGQIIFKHILNECTEAEKYFNNVTLKILLKELTEKYPVRSFEGLHTTIIQSHINGNLHYYLGDIAAANDCYAVIVKNSKVIEDFGVFQMSIMRYGKYLFDCGRYEKAIYAFEQCLFEGNCNLAAHFGVARSFYRLGQFDKAEQHFSVCTNYGIHIPDVWGYLALVNIKMQNTMKALESWKYAKLNPDNVINDEIHDELNQIDLKDVILNIDGNEKLNFCT